MAALDLILTGEILTLTHSRPRAGAVGVKDGRVAAVGEPGELRRAAGRRTEVLDVGRSAVLPGFIDTHVHPVEAGLVACHVDLRRVDSVAGILEAVRRRAAHTPETQPVLAFNFNYDIVRERRLPSLAELDAACGGRPAAVIVYDVHSAQVNSAMLSALALPAGSPGVALDEQGRPTGLLEDPAIGVLMERLQPGNAADAAAAVTAAARQAARAGLTALHAKSTLQELEAIADTADSLPVRIRPMVRLRPGDEEALAAALERAAGWPQAVIATYGDGAPDSRTAAFFEPYCTDIYNYGMLYYEDAALEELVRRVHLAGLRMSVHTCGTRATEQALQVFERVLARHPRPDHRHRIEHFEMPLGGHIRRAVRAGLVLAMQPAFLFLSGEGTFENLRALLGDERVGRWKPLRAILDAGGTVAGGSDAPVTPMDPLGGVQACVCHPNPAQRLTRFEALGLFTAQAAFAGGEEAEAGTIEVGKRADFTVLAQNPFAVGPAEIAAIPVEMTVVGGRVFAAGD